MTKQEFEKRRTEIISDLLDNPDKNGIYPTTLAFAQLDDLFDEITGHKYGCSEAQKLRVLQFTVYRMNKK